MLERFFLYPKVLKRMRRGPLADRIDAVAERLERERYARATARRYLSLIATFSRYAQEAGCSQAGAIDDDLVQCFLRDVPPSVSSRILARTAIGYAIPRIAPLRGPQRMHIILGRRDATIIVGFNRYMRDVRGLLPRTREGYVLVASRMLKWYRALRPGRQIRAMRGEHLLRYVSEFGATCDSNGSCSAAVAGLRALLRFLYASGILREDLSRFVPRVPSRRQERVPHHLEWSDVRAAIDSIDVEDSVGKRDRALMLVLATTGIRSQEVRRLELRDIHWRESVLHIRRTKSRRERWVPLVRDAGRAMADYILHGRPVSSEPVVFLTHVPPFGCLRHSGTVAAIVRRRLRSIALRADRAGAHLLRHSLATHLVQQMRPIKEVADLLGHRNIDTTAIYVKVALPQLRTVALPFPGASR